MKIFNNDLTPEEEQSGFTLNEVDGETFSIEQLGGEYPANIPDYNPVTFLNSMKDSNGEVNLANYNEIKYDIETKNSNKVEYNINAENEDILFEKNQNNNINIETIDDIFNMEQDDVTTSYEKIVEENKIENVPLIPANNTSDNENITSDNEDEQVILFDEEFLNLLKSDIANTPTNSKQNNNQKEIAEDVIQYNSSIYVDTSQGEEEFTADLLSMEMETKTNEKNNIDDIFTEQDNFPPSEENENEISEENNIENVFTGQDNFPPSEENENEINENRKNTDNIAKETDKNMTEKEEKQNNKKTFVLIIAIISVAMILIVGAIIGYLYLSNKQNIPAEPQKAELKDTLKLKDTLELKDTIKQEEDITEQFIDTTATQENETIDELPVSLPTTPVVTQKNPRRSPSQTKTSAKPVDTTSKEKIVKQKLENKTALYTIQIYSSPVKSDADKRLVMLSQRGIDGYITQQNIKGQIWYRVRFGSYEHYEDAKSVVEKLALKDAWIERIK